MLSGFGEMFLRMIFPAFAALDSPTDHRQLRCYKTWVNKLASKEYADELVVLATAQTVQVEIVCVPHRKARTRLGPSRHMDIGAKSLIHEFCWAIKMSITFGSP